MSVIAAWLAKEGVGLLLGALAKLILDGWNSYQANQALRQAGAAEAINKINVETVETKDAMEAVSRPSDDAVADSLRSGKF
ncbi:MAG: hypothetical protein CFE29_03270 [Bradyrhizobiaceae bacterium PARB1]|jgi:predicted negative regulator of RcsB-dependent stress response|nr:MAG: hypothetical protein CFE29_03270 [Bradyrhizobiaceae bacterium PARB1]